jgi:hypothetical protein
MEGVAALGPRRAELLALACVGLLQFRRYPSIHDPSGFQLTILHTVAGASNNPRPPFPGGFPGPERAACACAAPAPTRLAFKGTSYFRSRDSGSRRELLISLF